MKILTAVEPGDETHEAARVARELFPDAEHIAVGAASLAPYFVSDPLGGMYSAGPSLEAMEVVEQEADDAVHEAQAILGAGTEGQTEVGDPGRAICDLAEAEHVDVIVVGRRSRGWLSRLFDPSVSEYVVKHAPCPVLVVREHDHDTE